MTAGLIIVSHSKRLAEGVVELAHALAGDDVMMVATGGGGQQDASSFGVSVPTVLRAIAELGDLDEIGMIGDVGSSFLATAAAIELEGLEERVRIIDCPMVEGAIACAMVLAMGGSLADAAEAGLRAWEVRKVGG